MTDAQPAPQPQQTVPQVVQSVAKPITPPAQPDLSRVALANIVAQNMEICKEVLRIVKTIYVEVQLRPKFTYPCPICNKELDPRGFKMHLESEGLEGLELQQTWDKMSDGYYAQQENWKAEVRKNKFRRAK